MIGCQLTLSVDEDQCFGEPRLEILARLRGTTAKMAGSGSGMNPGNGK